MGLFVGVASDGASARRALAGRRGAKLGPVVVWAYSPPGMGVAALALGMVSACGDPNIDASSRGS